MPATKLYSNECRFCARYLKEHGVPSGEYFDEIVSLITDLDPDYKLLKVEKEDFFTDLAKRLRELWPSGEKEGKYPWKDSLTNTVRRLQLLWQLRGLQNYTLEDCLSAARKYLAQFEDNTKYMKTLKYFILKQKSDVVDNDGKLHYTQESTFADILEGKSDLSAEIDWTNDIDLTNTYEEGLLI